jgi:phosphatidylethanolamine-binding protein (PEBP) family uncharacterized protein
VKASWSLGALVVASILVGCGQPSPDRSTIRFESPAVRANGVISPDFRCGGGSIWLPLEWGPVPPDTKELVVYLGRFVRPTGTGSRRLRVPFGILITNIDPSTRGIPTNTLPPESVPLTYRTFNSCPPARKGQNVLLQLFALERPLQAPASPSSVSMIHLTEAALGIDRSVATPEWVAELTEESLASSRFTTTYGRNRRP